MVRLGEDHRRLAVIARELALGKREDGVALARERERHLRCTVGRSGRVNALAEHDEVGGAVLVERHVDGHVHLLENGRVDRAQIGVLDRLELPSAGEIRLGIAATAANEREAQRARAGNRHENSY